MRVALLLPAADAELQISTTMINWTKKMQMQVMLLENLRFAGSVHLFCTSLANRDDPLLS